MLLPPRRRRRRRRPALLLLVPLLLLLTAWPAGAPSFQRPPAAAAAFNKAAYADIKAFDDGQPAAGKSPRFCSPRFGGTAHAADPAALSEQLLAALQRARRTSASGRSTMARMATASPAAAKRRAARRTRTRTAGSKSLTKAGRSGHTPARSGWSCLQVRSQPAPAAQSYPPKPPPIANRVPGSVAAL